MPRKGGGSVSDGGAGRAATGTSGSRGGKSGGGGGGFSRVNPNGGKRKQIESILNRLERGGSAIIGMTHHHRGGSFDDDDSGGGYKGMLSTPPDEVSAALGRSLARAYMGTYVPSLLLPSDADHSEVVRRRHIQQAKDEKRMNRKDREDMISVGWDILRVLSSIPCQNGSTSWSYFAALRHEVDHVVRWAIMDDLNRTGKDSSATDDDGGQCPLVAATGDDLRTLLEVWSMWIPQLEEWVVASSTHSGRGEDPRFCAHASAEALSASIAMYAEVSFGYVAMDAVRRRRKMKDDGLGGGGGFEMVEGDGGEDEGSEEKEQEEEEEEADYSSDHTHSSFVAGTYKKLTSFSCRCRLLSCAASFVLATDSPPSKCDGDDRQMAHDMVLEYLSPLLATCVLDPAVHPEEKRVLVSSLLRQCRQRLGSSGVWSLEEKEQGGGEGGGTIPARSSGGLHGSYTAMISCLSRLLALFVQMNTISGRSVKAPPKMTSDETGGGGRFIGITSVPSASDLAMEWTGDVAEVVLLLITCTSVGEDEEGKDEMQRVCMQFVVDMVTELIPWFVVMGGSSYTSPRQRATSADGRTLLRPLLVSLRDIARALTKSKSTSRCIKSCGREGSYSEERNHLAIIRLGLSALSSPVESDIEAMLRLLATLVDMLSTFSTGSDSRSTVDAFARQVCNALGVIFSAAGSDCSTAARRLRQMALVRNSQGEHTEVDAYGTMLSLFHSHGGMKVEGVDANPDRLAIRLLQSICPSPPPGEEEDGRPSFLHRLPSSSQSTLALLGTMCLSSETLGVRDEAFQLTERMLHQAPNLAIRLYPVALHIIQRTVEQGMNTSVAIQATRLLCGPITANPHCASQAWSVMKQWTDPNSPLTLRAFAMRSLPIMCGTNRRMFNRVQGVLVSNLRDPSVEVRVAIAAAMSDMCQTQSEESAGELIGPLQAYLEDESPLVVALSMTALHGLVEAQCLDFDLTYKVLKKRLGRKFSMDDVGQILEQDVEVVIALVTLLGDGDCDGDGRSTGSTTVASTFVSSSELEEVDPPSPQVGSAISLLSAFLASSGEENLPAPVRVAVLKSLSQYNVQLLGVSADSIRAVVSSDEEAESESTQRYRGTCKQLLDCFVGESSDEARLHIEVLTRKIISAEEGALGVSLWTKPESKSAAAASTRKTVSKAALAALPNPRDVKSFFVDEPSAASATGALFGMKLLPFTEDDGDNGDSSIRDYLAILSDIAVEMQNSGTGLLFRMTGLSGWLQGTRKLWWAALSQAVEDEAIRRAASIVDGLFDLIDSLDNPDSIYVVMAASVVFLSEYGESSKMFSQVDKLRGRVLDAAMSSGVESEDDASICLALLAIQAIRSQDARSLDDLIDNIIKFLDDSAGRSFFGPYLGLGLIAEALAVTSSGDGETAAGGRIKRVVARMLTEFIGCLENDSTVLQSLPATVQTGKPPPDLLSSLKSLEKGSLQVCESAADRFEVCCLGLGFALPSLAHVHMDFVVASYDIFRDIPWGTGKGYALPSLAKTLLDAGLLVPAAIEVLRAECTMAATIENSFQDASLTLAGLTSSSETLAEEILPSFRDRLAEDAAPGAEAAALAACSLLGYVPGIPPGGKDRFHTFTSPPYLKPTASKADVKSISSALEDFVNSERADTRSQDGAIIALGILSGMKNQTEEGVLSSGSRSRSQSILQGGSSGSHAKKVNFQAIPRAREGTMVRRLLEIVERCYNLQTGSNGTSLASLLRCIGQIALPSQFSQMIYSMMIGSASDVRMECVRVMSMQVALYGSRDFVGIMAEISRLPIPAFQALLDTDEVKLGYLKSLAYGLPLFSTGYVEKGMTALWNICCRDLVSEGRVDSAVSLLTALSSLLDPSRLSRRFEGGKRSKKLDTMSPAALTALQKLIVDTIYPSMVSLVKPPGMQVMDESQSQDEPQVNFTEACKLWEAYLDCIAEIPLHQLEAKEFFLFTECKNKQSLSDTLCRAFVTTHMVRCGSFDLTPDRINLELSKLRIWLSCQHVLDAPAEVRCAQLHSMRLVALQITLSSFSAKSSVRKDIILRSFDILLAKGPSSSLCLEQLALQVAYWWQDDLSSSPAVRGARFKAEILSSHSCLLLPLESSVGNVPTLSRDEVRNIVGSCLSDLSWNLGVVCTQMGILETVDRQTIQILNRVEEHSEGMPFDDAEASLNALRQISFCCHSEGHNFESLASFASLRLKKERR